MHGKRSCLQFDTSIHHKQCLGGRWADCYQFSGCSSVDVNTYYSLNTHNLPLLLSNHIYVPL